MAGKQGRIDRGFLGEAALRLARLLDVGGLVTPEFNSEERIQPVVLVGDGTLPGMGAQRQRRLHLQGQMASGTMNHFQPAQDIVIERWDFNVVVFGAAVDVIVSYKGPSDAIGAEVPGGAFTSLLTDRANSQVESAPITQRVGGTRGRIIWRTNMPLVESAPWYQGPFLLQKNARLICDPTGVGSTIQWNIYGYLF